MQNIKPVFRIRISLYIFFYIIYLVSSFSYSSFFDPSKYYKREVNVEQYPSESSINWYSYLNLILKSFLQKGNYLRIKYFLTFQVIHKLTHFLIQCPKPIMIGWTDIQLISSYFIPYDKFSSRYLPGTRRNLKNLCSFQEH